MKVSPVPKEDGRILLQLSHLKGSPGVVNIKIHYEYVTATTPVKTLQGYPLHHTLH